jgi:cytochrome c biogenesis protein CcdA
MNLSFIRGLVAAVNPCGFILLPTYLMYFLGITAGAGGSQRATIRRALLVSAAVSAGFLSVFFVAGLISYNFTSWINENAKYATGAIGGVLIVLGMAMLFGYKLPFMTPQVGVGKKERTVRAMFIYGIAYAVASIGCTIGLFIATVFSTTQREGIVQGVGNTVAYGAGMALLVSALTVSLAFANTTLLRWLRGSLAYVDRVAAAFVLLSGFYLIWYFYWVDLREEGDPITDWAFEQQARATQFLDDNWKPVAIVLGTVVAVAVAYVMFRTGDEDGTEEATVDVAGNGTEESTVDVSGNGSGQSTVGVSGNGSEEATVDVAGNGSGELIGDLAGNGSSATLQPVEDVADPAVADA